MQGVAGLFRGITPTLLGILPYSGIAFTFNEQGKRKVGIMLRRVALRRVALRCVAILGMFSNAGTHIISCLLFHASYCRFKI
jgi:hypothetical protein